VIPKRYISQLGKVPDLDLARKLSVSKSTVSSRRRELGIAPCLPKRVIGVDLGPALGARDAANISRLATDPRLGALLKASRVASGESLEQLAQRSGVGRGPLSKLERGTPHAPWSSIVRLLRAMGWRLLVELPSGEQREVLGPGAAAGGEE